MVEDNTRYYFAARAHRVIKDKFGGKIDSDLRYWVWSLDTGAWPEYEGAYTTYNDAIAHKHRLGNRATVWWVPLEVFYACDAIGY
jgi:hypothetical protein